MGCADDLNPVNWPKKISKEAKRTAKTITKEVTRLQKQAGVPSDLTMQGMAEFLGDRSQAMGLGQDLNPARFAGVQDPAKTEDAPFSATVKPPSSFGGDVLASQERLRKRLALQMSTSKTNVTFGVRGFSQTVRPTLMTL